MHRKAFPVINPVATGANIRRPRAQRGLSVLDLHACFRSEEPQVIYKWQKRRSLLSVDNLYTLGALLEVPMEEILVSAGPRLDRIVCEPQVSARGSPLFGDVFVRWRGRGGIGDRAGQFPLRFPAVCPGGRPPFRAAVSPPPGGGFCGSPVLPVGTHGDMRSEGYIPGPARRAIRFWRTGPYGPAAGHKAVWRLWTFL